MTTQTLEERVTALEAEVARLCSRAVPELAAVAGKTAPDFLERFAGIFANDPTFEEAARLGREWRYTECPHKNGMQ